MAGAFSGHLINSYTTANQAQSPFGRPIQSESHISTHGSMSFNPQAHGSFQSQSSFSYNDSQPLFQDVSDATTIKINTLQAKLNQKLGPEFISQRPGPGGAKLTYAEGWKIINLANEVFGFNGWSSNVVNITTDFIDFNEESKKFTVGVTAIVRVTLRDGVFHEDIGYGMLENSKSKGAALDKCKKEAVTDALKRSLRNFGNLLGNCLYDKSYTQEVIKIKVQPPKFDKSQLHRRPEFDESKPKPIPSTSTAQVTPGVKQDISAKPLSSIPPHMRSEATPNAKSTTSHVTPPPPPPYNPNHTPAAPRTGLNTPIQTPAHKGGMQTPTRPQSVQQQSPQDESLQESLIPENDESFNYSDDDAFLAAVDLGEVDMGRPIDFEEGAAGDVDAGGTTAASNLSSGSSVTGKGVGGSMGPPTSIGTRTGPLNVTVNAGQPQRQQRPVEKSNSNSNISTMYARNQNSHQNMASNPAPRTTSVNQSSTTIQQDHAQPHARSTSSDRSRMDLSGRPIHNQNHVPNTNTNGATSATARKPSTPSMGFHFPPGINSLTTSKQLPHPQQRPAGPLNSGAVSSLKRSADVMNAPSAASRRSLQGMGLAQQQGSNAQVKREPFTRLEMGESGEVKRMKI